MSNTSVNDHNISETINVIDDLSMNLDRTVQTLLLPAYKEFPFLAKTFLDIPLANLFAAITVFLLFLLFRKFFTYIVMGSLQKASKLTKNYYDDKIISALKSPVSFGFVLIGLHLFFLLIFKSTPFIKNILNMLVLYAIFWAIIAVLDAMRGLFHRTTARFNPDLEKELGDFMLKVFKILIAGVGLGAILQVWSINVTALIASLGLGGLAFALAAKDAASNLFGSFALLADRSIRIGEWIRVGEVEGTVEEIGMRTTKIRSFEKSLFTVPNQIVANSPIENFSRRGARRIKMNIGLTYNTTSSQMQNIVSQIKEMMQSHQDISHDDTLLVNFNSLGESALNIFVYAFIRTSDWAKYLTIREEIHLKIMKIVEENNCSFAFPSQTIYMESLPEKTVL